MADYSTALESLLKQSEGIVAPSMDMITPFNDEDKMKREEWLNDVKIFTENYLKEHPLYNDLHSALFHRKWDAYNVVLAKLRSLAKDTTFTDKMNGIALTTVPMYQAKTLPKYDVFISHANKDKNELIEDLYNSLKKLGVSIFYDKETLEWGDDWKKKILEGTQKSEFAIIVISKNFFGREWTEKELVEFLNRQNRNGQKLILPILKDIKPEQLREKYPAVSDIQAIDSSKFTTDEIALLFANQLIKRLKAVQ